jgi:ubiquinone/menaquinone biosynthesis C-methylase UbiE
MAPADGLDVLARNRNGPPGQAACCAARTMRAFGRSRQMLAIARDRLDEIPEAWTLVAVADHRRLPIPPQSADVLVSGCSARFLAAWNPK